MAGMGIGMRTIWVALRAVNYSKPAFDQATSQVKALKEWQERLIKHQKEMYQQARMMIGVGLMYVAMGAMVGFAISKMISMSITGSQYMDKFSETAEKAMSAIGDALLKTLKPVLDTISAFLKLISENKALSMLIANMLVLASASLIFMGVLKMLRGALILLNMQSLMTGNVGLQALVKGFFTADFSAKMLLGTLMKIFFIFYIFYSLSEALAQALGGPLQAAIVMLIPALAIIVGMLWAGASAMSVLTFGAAAVAGIAGMVAMQAVGPPQYAIGTRFVQRTTPAIVHAGEEIRTAQDAREQNKPSITTIQATIDLSGSTINTKADEEELTPTINRAVKRALREAIRSKE